MEKELVMNTPNTAMEETNRSLQRREKGEKERAQNRRQQPHSGCSRHCGNAGVLRPVH